MCVLHLLIHSSIVGHLGCFHSSAIVNNDAWNIQVHISFQKVFFCSSNKYPEVEFAGSCAGSVLNFLRTFHTVFLSGCTNLQSHHQCTKGAFSLHPFQHFLFLIFTILAILTDGKWYLIVVLMCVFLMANVECICVASTCIVSLEKCLFRSFVYFKIKLLVCLLLRCKHSLYIPDIISYQTCGLQKFSPIPWVVSSLLR